VTTGFRKTAKVEHVATLAFDADNGGLRKTAQLDSASDAAQRSYYLDGSAKVDVRGILERQAQKFAISADPSDYLFEVIRANTTSVFNDNHDGFAREELLRFDPRLKTAVFLTYREKPHHVNHRTDNPKRARGVILDSHYNAEATPLENCPGCNLRTAERKNRDKSGIYCRRCATVVNDEFVEILVAVDKKKDPAFARAVETGQLRFGSMGCTCAETVCNVCGNVARTQREFCKHIASHKGSYWAKKADEDDWSKINPRTAEAEMKRRKRAFHQRDFVALKAEDGYEVRKAAEWCQGVEYDEYSRVHMPADPKAERIELLNKAAGAGDPTPEDLRSETAHLVAAARTATRGRRQKAAGQERAAMKFYVVRVDGDPLDTYAAESLDMALEMAGPEEGAQIEVAEVEADDAGAARLMPSDEDYQPHMGADANHEMEGDVTINITEDPATGEESVETVDDPAPDPTSIEDFTDEVLNPEPETPGRDEFSPEELGVMPAGASKEATAVQHTSYADWSVQVTPQGVAQVIAPSGPALLVTPKKALKDDQAKMAFGQEIMDHLCDHGLLRTAEKYEANFHAKFASVVDGAIDDMKEYSDKDSKPDVASGGESDMAGEHGGDQRGMHADDVRDENHTDMEPGSREPKVEMTDQNRASDHELGNTDDRPDSSSENEGSDMREKRPEFSVSQDDALQNAVFDHAERVAMVGKWVEGPEGKTAKVASYAKEAQTFTLVDNKLSPSEVQAGDLIKQWKQLDQAPSSYEDNLKRWAKTEIEKARKAAVSDVFRVIRIAAQRSHKGLERSPLKEAVATQLANQKVVGHDGVSRAPLEYQGMSDELAIHLVEAAFADAGERDIDTLLSRAAKLMKHDTNFLKSAETDLSKTAHRVPVVTAASMVDDLDREAEVLRRSASAGNLELAPQPSEDERSTRVAAQTNGNAGKIRSALGGTRAAARIQLRQ
jgi:uncharacterized protein YciU (UPF0263 family)